MAPKFKYFAKSNWFALLDWRNTLTEGIGTSPAQRLMGRRTRTLLPTHQNLLKPRLAEETYKQLNNRKKIQKREYDKGSHKLPPLKPGQAVRMKLPGRNNWSLGSCITSLPNRSYEVEIAGRRYRRTKRHLRTTTETPLSTTPEQPEENDNNPEAPDQAIHDTEDNLSSSDQNLPSQEPT